VPGKIVAFVCKPANLFLNHKPHLIVPNVSKPVPPKLYIIDIRNKINIPAKPQNFAGIIFVIYVE